MKNNIRNIILKVLKEEKEPIALKSNVISNSSDFYFYKTTSGNLLLLPKSSKPKILSTVNKQAFKNATDTPDEINKFANKPHINEACKKFHPELPIEECYDLFVAYKYQTIVDGGVQKFEATLPSGERSVFTSCTKAYQGGKITDFTKWKSAGYFPNIKTNGKCEGNPWFVDMSAPTTEKEEDFGQRINFSLKIQMIK
jgi:hypothetical protein